MLYLVAIWSNISSSKSLNSKSDGILLWIADTFSAKSSTLVLYLPRKHYNSYSDEKTLQFLFRLSIRYNGTLRE